MPNPKWVALSQLFHDAGSAYNIRQLFKKGFDLKQSAPFEEYKPKGLYWAGSPGEARVLKQPFEFNYPTDAVGYIDREIADGKTDWLKNIIGGTSDPKARWGNVDEYQLQDLQERYQRRFGEQPDYQDKVTRRMAKKYDMLSINNIDDGDFNEVVQLKPNMVKARTQALERILGAVLGLKGVSSGLENSQGN